MQHEMQQFENDVKTYGTQTKIGLVKFLISFENDVKTYGTQTGKVNLDIPP